MNWLHKHRFPKHRQIHSLIRSLILCTELIILLLNKYWSSTVCHNMYSARFLEYYTEGESATDFYNIHRRHTIVCIYCMLIILREITWSTWEVGHSWRGWRHVHKALTSTSILPEQNLKPINIRGLAQHRVSQEFFLKKSFKNNIWGRRKQVLFTQIITVLFL